MILYHFSAADLPFCSRLIIAHRLFVVALCIRKRILEGRISCKRILHVYLRKTLPPPRCKFHARIPESKRAQTSKAKIVQRLRGKVTVNVEPMPGVEFSETLPP